MTWSPVPWFVAGGDHTPESARNLVHNMTNGAEGVVEAGDCKVIALTVPGGAVDVLPGGLVVPNRAAGVSRQSYAGDNPDADRVTLNPTSSAGARSDLIIARVEDPAYPGTPAGSPPPYIRSRVIEGVPAGTKRVQELAGHTTSSAATLAIVTRPANTSTVLNSHITDLRQLVRPRTKRTLLSGAASEAALNTTTDPGALFPPAGLRTVAVPSWATTIQVAAHASGILTPAATAGYMRLRLGAADNPDVVHGAWTGFDAGAAGNPMRFDHMVALSSQVPASMRGSTVELNVFAKKITGTASPTTNGFTSWVYDVEFSESLA